MNDEDLDGLLDPMYSHIDPDRYVVELVYSEQILTHVYARDKVTGRRYLFNEVENIESQNEIHRLAKVEIL